MLASELVQSIKERIDDYGDYEVVVREPESDADLSVALIYYDGADDKIVVRTY